MENYLYSFYEITNSVDQMKYVGGTKLKLRYRWNKHLYETEIANSQKLLHNYMRKIGIDKFQVNLIKELMCSKLDARKIEQEYILLVPIELSLNMVRAYISPEQAKEYKHNYYEKNKDVILEYKHNYYENNKDVLLAKQKEFYLQNKDRICARVNTYRLKNNDAIKAKKKAYREANKEKIAAQKKAYREANKEKIAAKKRADYFANPEPAKARAKAWHEAKKAKLNE